MKKNIVLGLLLTLFAAVGFVNAIAIDSSGPNCIIKTSQVAINWRMLTEDCPNGSKWAHCDYPYAGQYCCISDQYDCQTVSY